MIAGEKENSIFFNHSFDKKRLKALISWVFKKSGEAEALRVLDLLKETGFRNATRAGISIGLHDLTTPATKSWLISESQQSMNNTDRDFVGAKITATERSQRIIDTWHRASESLSKQVVDYFGTYDAFNPVYIMALSGARGNFSQVRQLIGMRGLMADQQGKIVNFPIRSNLREGLTITEYFISCSGARKGLVDTALRTADTGYLTRRLVDVSHHVVVKRIRCNTNRGIVFKDLQSYNKILLSLKERLVGRVLAENILINTDKDRSSLQDFSRAEIQQESINDDDKFILQSRHEPAKKGSKHVRSFVSASQIPSTRHERAEFVKLKFNLLAEKDREINPELALKITQHRTKVLIRSPLTCAFTHEVCQLCYGWSISQGSLVSLGDAVGVIAAQSIGEPGTQLTMRTFHTGGVFSGDLLQEVRAPHAGRIEFSKAFQGLLIRTGHGRIAFLSKASGSLFLIKDESMNIQIRHVRASNFFDRSINDGQEQKKDSPVPSAETSAETPKQSTALHRLPTDRLGKETDSEANFTTITIQPFTMLFVRQGEFVKKNSLLAEYSIQRKEGNQPIKTEQTLFAGLSGRVIEDRTGKTYLKYLKESSLLTATLRNYMSQSDLQAQHIRASFCSPTLYTSNKSSSLSTPKRILPSVTDTSVPRYKYKSSCKFGTFVSASQISASQISASQISASQISASQIPSTRHERANVIRLRGKKICTCKRKFTSGNSTAEFISTKNKKLTVQDICKTQLLISYKAEDLENDLFRYIEPVKSGRLGFLKILSTRVGATFDYTCPITPFNFYKYLQNSFFKHDEWTYNRLINKVLLPRFSEQIRHVRFSFADSEHSESAKLKETCEGAKDLYAEKRHVRAKLGTFARSCQVPKPNLALKDLEKNCITTKYLHPEFVKDNLFFLRTIAEYGDILDEDYKYKI